MAGIACPHCKAVNPERVSLNDSYDILCKTCNKVEDGRAWPHVKHNRYYRGQHMQTFNIVVVVVDVKSLKGIT